MTWRAIVSGAVQIMVVLHGLDGRLIVINPRLVTIMTAQASNQKNTHMAPGVKCLLNLSDGKFVSVTETCDEVTVLFQKWRDHRDEIENPHPKTETPQ